MANKPEGDVTRKAVELATLKLGKAKEKLKTLIYTGPDNVLMSQRDIDNRIADGEAGLLPHASGQQSPEGVDNALLDQMLAGGQLRGGI